MNSSYQKIREKIIEDCNLIIKLPDDIFDEAKVETIIIGFDKNFATNNLKVIKHKKNENINTIDNKRFYNIDKQIWKEFEDLNFNIYLSEDIQKVISKAIDDTVFLEEVADFSLGITPYDKYKGHSKELIENKEYHSSVKIDEKYKPLIKGENITRYFINPEIKEFIKYGDWLGASREEKFFTDERVIVRKIVSGKPPRIYAGYTKNPYYFTQIGFSIVPKRDVTAAMITGLLNSKLINFIHKYLYLDIEKELFQKVLIQNCKKFPIPSNITQPLFEIEKNVFDINNLKSEDPTADTSSLEEEIDQMVYELYGLTEEEIAIVENSTKY